MATHILRLKRTDEKNQHLLLHISQTGSKHLDLKLVGTEHEHLYHTTFKEANVKSFQSKQFSGDLQEFKNVLKYTLLHEKEDGPLPDALQGLETVAAISEKILTVSLRKNIGGITQRLGAIKLDQDDEREEVSAFDWVDNAVANADTLRAELETLQTAVSEQKEQVAKLSTQLDDLVRAKKEHEDELLKKFAALLNAKKLKIRDQQRLLKGAKIESGVAEAVGDARGSRRGAGASRSGKRTAERVAETEEGDEVENDVADEEDRQMEETPPATDWDVTDDEGDLDAGGIAPRPLSSRIKGSSDLSQAGEDSKGNGAAEMDVDDPGEVPPRRELPFQRKSIPSAKPPEPEEEDEETDGEL